MEVYAAWQNDLEIRKNSSSGGVFPAICKYFLGQGSYICGAVFDFTEKTPTVKHILTQDPTEVKNMCGSKYVQSEITGVFPDIIEKLEEGNRVLFSGTACQVAALKKLLLVKNIDTSRLFTVDVLCHGTPSPKIFSDYCEEMQKRYGSKISEVNFRYKKPGWTVFSMMLRFENGKKYIADKFTDAYLIGFLNDYYPRRSCEKCPYTCLKREGDITLADFWGYRSHSFRMKNNERGISEVLVNTEIGQLVWERISKNLVYEERIVEDILGANRSYSKPWERNIESELFWENYNNYGWEITSKKMFKPSKLDLKSRIMFAVYRNWWLIPKVIRGNRR